PFGTSLPSSICPDDPVSGCDFPWITFEGGKKFRKFGFLDHARRLFIAEPAAGPLLLLGPFLGLMLDLEREDGHLAAPLDPGVPLLAVIIAADLCFADPAFDAGFLERLARGRFKERFAALGPPLRQDPAAPAAARDQKHLDTVRPVPPGQGGCLHAGRIAAEQPAQPFQNPCARQIAHALSSASLGIASVKDRSAAAMGNRQAILRRETKLSAALFPRSASGRKSPCPRGNRSEERRVGKECRSRWPTDH